MNEVSIIIDSKGTPIKNKKDQFVFSKEGVNFALSIEQMEQLEKLIKLIKR